ncbi:MAG TPA: ABC transporter permease [Gaiellaceae bacterium]|jgi:ABC-type transport system involved in multi-copper enzyme maturation permease subunit
MSGQFVSELRKVRTTRTAPLLLLAAVAFALLGIVAVGLSATVEELAREDDQRTFFGSAATNAVFFATFVGLLVVTNEFRYGTIRPTLLFEPRRRVVLAAKLAAAALAGVLFAAVCTVVSFGFGLPLLAARDVDIALTGPHALTIVFGTLAAAALGAMMGVAVGALIRNQVGAIVVLAGYSVAFDTLLFATMPSLGRFLPAEALSALAGLPDEGLLTPGVGAAVALAWTLAFSVAAAARTDRSDV